MEPSCAATSKLSATTKLSRHSPDGLGEGPCRTPGRPPSPRSSPPSRAGSSGTVRDRLRQRQGAQEVGEVVRQGTKLKADGVGPEGQQAEESIGSKLALAQGISAAVKYFSRLRR